MTAELQARALAYARTALTEITRDPNAFGITEPWETVDEWIDFELDGDAGDQFTTAEEREAITAAMREIADLETLNAPWAS